MGTDLFAVAIPFNRAFNRKAAKAINYYNSGYTKTARVNFKMQMDAKGLGLAMKF